MELINDRDKYQLGELYEWAGLKDGKLEWEVFKMTPEILRVSESYTIRNICKKD